MKHPKQGSTARYEPKELAHALGISLAKLYEDVRANRIPHIRLQRRIVLPRTAIDHWLATCGKDVA